MFSGSAMSGLCRGWICLDLHIFIWESGKCSCASASASATGTGESPLVVSPVALRYFGIESLLSVEVLALRGNGV